MKREEVNYLSSLVEPKVLQKFYEKVANKSNITVLSAPTEQTLLVPVKDPISGGSFYGGEVLVTSCLVQVDETKGWSMIMDKEEKKALYVAVLDACFAQELFQDEIEDLLNVAQKELEKQTKKNNQKINSTRVSFDLM